MTDNKRKTRAEILQELESIQGLLLEEDDIPTLLADDDIPLLEEVFEDDRLEQTPADTTAGKSANVRPTRTSPTKAEGENPFLPQHIRARLHGNKPPPSFQLEPSPPPRSATQKTGPAPEAQARQELIDSVLAALQPDIERELRHQLEQLSGDTLQRLLPKS